MEQFELQMDKLKNRFFQKKALCSKQQRQPGFGGIMGYMCKKNATPLATPSTMVVAHSLVCQLFKFLIDF